MSTRARIALALANGKYKSIYVHQDGYPQGVGQVLAQHYSTTARVKALLALGDVSRLAPKLAPPAGQPHSYREPLDGVSVAYRRDRGDKDNGVVTSVNFTALAALSRQCNAEYVYVFSDDRWQFVAMSWVTGRPIPTEQDLHEVTA
jgi:hypothetical protein